MFSEYSLKFRLLLYIDLFVAVPNHTSITTNEGLILRECLGQKPESVTGNNFQNNYCISLKIDLVLANSAYPDEILPYVAFHVGLVFTVWNSTCSWVLKVLIPFLQKLI